MTARTLMIQGTASSVGKSLLTAALCRVLVQEGLRVAPFKSQNMALNAFVTASGGEIGRAQAVQAEASRVAPTVDMNPILLKPEAGSRCQVIVLGKPIGTVHSSDYDAKKADLRGVVKGALERLRATCDVVVIEGAGSPAEVNLKAHDLANMFVAEIADAPVLLVGDIDRGGVFASLVGTLELLEPHERARVAGFIVNKFRGDVALLQPGLDMLTQRTGVPVVGVVPYVSKLRVADEDSVALDDRRGRRRATVAELEIAIVRLPHASNHDDFQPLEHEPGVVVRFVEDARALEGADLVVVPGSKSTVADLAWLRATGFADAIVAHAARGGRVLGVCGGCQMLGATIADPHGVESDVARVDGLGLLAVDTTFALEKRTSQLVARARTRGLFGSDCDVEIVGYEIHSGRVARREGCAGAFVVERRNGVATEDVDGAVSADGRIVGTMIHGLFDGAAARGALLRVLRERRALPPPSPPLAPVAAIDELDRLADVVRANVDVKAVLRMIGR